MVLSESTHATVAERTDSRLTIRDLVLWSFAGSVCAAGAWTGGFVLASRVLLPPITETVGDNLANAALVWCMIGMGTGCVIGAFVGLILAVTGRSERIVGLSIGGACAGAIGGGLTPIAVVAANRDLSSLVSSSIAWAFAGLLTGGIARIVSRAHASFYDWDADEEPRELHSTTRPSPGRDRRRTVPNLVWCFPILVLSGLSLLAACMYPWSNASLALLVVGLLGPSTVFVLARQDRRIRELERILRLGR